MNTPPTETTSPIKSSCSMYSMKNLKKNRKFPRNKNYHLKCIKYLWNVTIRKLKRFSHIFDEVHVVVGFGGFFFAVNCCAHDDCSNKK